jgi:hypothetical protein
MKSASILAAALAALVFAGSAGAVDGNDPIAAWVTDGTVDSLCLDGAALYIGGEAAFYVYH